MGFKKGYKQTEESKRKIGEANTGSKHGNWAGDDVGYFGVHSYVKRHLPKPDKCMGCGRVGSKEKYQGLQLSNNSGKYLRELSDWEWICAKCHVKKDDIGFKLGHEKTMNRPFTEEEREKIRQSKLGKPRSEETKKKISKKLKGKKPSIETRKKMSESHKGKTPWNKGLKKRGDKCVRS